MEDQIELATKASAIKANFVRAIEIWVPASDRGKLTLKSGHYGELDYFERISRGMRFAFDEGLPGKCWAAGRPIILKDLANSYFKRGDAAMNVGLSCAVALPTFVGPDLTAVTVLFCGDDAQQIGAVELWRAAPGEPQMSLDDGYFGRLEKFEFTSRHTQFAPTTGLPGRVWDQQMPVILDDLGRADQFVRHGSAQKVGLSRGIGIPVPVRDPSDNWVITFLSARNSPIARRVEFWAPHASRGTFGFVRGYCENGEDLGAIHANAFPPLDAGALGEARLTCRPVLTGDLDGRLAHLIIPIVQKGKFAGSLMLFV